MSALLAVGQTVMMLGGEHRDRVGEVRSHFNGDDWWVTLKPTRDDPRGRTIMATPEQVRAVPEKLPRITVAQLQDFITDCAPEAVHVPASLRRRGVQRFPRH